MADSLEAAIPSEAQSVVYGKGFSMLRKMGFEGGGLGKDGGGITVSEECVDHHFALLSLDMNARPR